MKFNNLKELVGALDLESIIKSDLPPKFEYIWKMVNSGIQEQKLQQSKIDPETGKNILANFKKRAFLLSEIARVCEAKNIAEVGTAQAWQTLSFAQGLFERNAEGEEVGKVYTCDIRDVRNTIVWNKLSEFCSFTSGTSRDMTKAIGDNKIDMFYIDGSHDQYAVFQDVLALKEVQSENCLWVFDDFDDRFGAAVDMASLMKIPGLDNAVFDMGVTASGQPNHLLILMGRM